MKNLCFCFQMHAPYRLKRYRFFEIGQDHYYYDDMQTEESIQSLVQLSYMPLCKTLQEMITVSKRKFRCALSISGVMIEMFERFAPEMIDVLKELADTKCVEFVAVPYSYSLSAVYDEADFLSQLERQTYRIKELFGLKPTTVWNTELLYSDEIGAMLAKAGYKIVMAEGAKQILSWKSPNYLYNSVSSNKLKVLMRNAVISDEISFRFSDSTLPGYPMDANRFADRMVSLPNDEEVVNIWMGAETFGIRQPANSGIFDFLKAIPYFILEREMGFVTPAEAAKMCVAKDSVVAPYPMTWAGVAKDLGAYNGNDLQQEALTKLYAVAERVNLCQDKNLKHDWLMLQVLDHFRYMNHIDASGSTYESAYDAFINYMNVLADFLQMVEEQYPKTIENEELNELLKTIKNQEKEIAELKAETKKLKKKA